MFNGGRSTGGMAGMIVLIGLILAFAFGGFNLPIFFIALALASLVSSLGSSNRGRTFGSIQGFIWLLALAFFFATGSWLWFLLAIAASAILGPMARSMIGNTNNRSFNQTAQGQQTPYYQPTQPPPYQPYQQGYQPAQTETYQESEPQYHYPPEPPQPYEPSTQQYDQPQAQYPQQMPPQQQ